LEYRRVCKYLDHCLIFGIKPGLVRVRKLLELLKNPQERVEFIHIVGTNGKTSTAKITARILKNHGIKTSYHISPHISTYTERIWINGENVSEEKFSETFNQIHPYIKEVNKMNLEGPLTQFEIISAMAFKLAENEGVKIMVLEAGMGGRWDATNVADSKVVGLTGVSLEHTELLGKTIKEITSEKVEVIKKGALVATTSCHEEVLKILSKKVKETNSKLFLFGKDFNIIKKVNLGLEGWLLDIKGVKNIYRNLKLPVLGHYQPLNLSLSIALAELYMETKKKELNDKKIREGLKFLKIKGRFEIIRKKPLMIADTSHNPEGIENFVKDIISYFGKRRKIIIFAVLKDKDYKSMIKKVLGVSNVLILTSSLKQRSLDVNKLEELVKREIKEIKLKKGSSYPGELYRIDSIKDSIKFALKISDINDIICITGSITNLESIVK